MYDDTRIMMMESMPKRRQDDVEILLIKQQLETLTDTVTKVTEDMAKIINRHDRELFGDQEYLGQKGEIGVLKEEGKKRLVRERVLFVGFISLVIEAIVELFKAKGHL